MGVAEVLCGGNDDDSKGGGALEDSGWVVLSAGDGVGVEDGREDGGGAGEEDGGRGEGDGEGVGATLLVAMRAGVVSGNSITMEVLDGSRVVVVVTKGSELAGWLTVTIVCCSCEDMEMVIWASEWGQSARRRKSWAREGSSNDRAIFDL